MPAQGPSCFGVGSPDPGVQVTGIAPPGRRGTTAQGRREVHAVDGDDSVGDSRERGEWTPPTIDRENQLRTGVPQAKLAESRQRQQQIAQRPGEEEHHLV